MIKEAKRKAWVAFIYNPSELDTFRADRKLTSRLPHMKIVKDLIVQVMKRYY